MGLGFSVRGRVRVRARVRVSVRVSVSHQVVDLRLRVVSGIVAAVDNARCTMERREDE